MGSVFRTVNEVDPLMRIGAEIEERQMAGLGDAMSFQRSSLTERLTS